MNELVKMKIRVLCVLFSLFVVVSMQSDEENTYSTYEICKMCKCEDSISKNVTEIDCKETTFKISTEKILWPEDGSKNYHVDMRHLGIERIEKLSRNGQIALLNFDFNNIRYIESAAFTLMPRLTKLTMADNVLTEVTFDMFQNLTNLEELDLSGNKIEKFNEYGFEELVSLKVLKLDRNLLQEIPTHFLSKLPSLQNLHISNNKLFYLDYKELKGLTNILNNMRFLDFSYNKFQMISKDTFEEMTSLTTLILSNNVIDKVDENAFRNCRNLSILDLSYNQIKTLKYTLVDLQVLNLASNKFLQWPTFPSDAKIKSLDLSCNEIAEIYDEKQITFKNLEYLNISHNNIKDWSATNSLENLLVLDFSWNIMTELPEYISSEKLPLLTELYIDGNYFETLSFPREIKLEMLSANSLMNLKQIGPYIKVRERDDGCLRLHISHCNELSIIEKDAFKNMKLCYLDLSNNKLNHLSEDVADWSELDGVNLQGNPWSCQCELQWVLSIMMPKLYKNHSTLLHELRCDSPRQYQGLRFVHWYDWPDRAFCGDGPEPTGQKQNYYITPLTSESSESVFAEGNGTIVISLIAAIIVGIIFIVVLVVLLARGRRRHNPRTMQKINRRRQTIEDGKKAGIDNEGETANL